MKKKQKKQTNPPRYFTAKEHKMFPPELTALMRFIRYKHPVKCLACGKLSRKHWTMLCPFHAIDFKKPWASRFATLDSVCEDHPLAPSIPHEAIMGNG
jgi:hypothetical protein